MLKEAFNSAYINENNVLFPLIHKGSKHLLDVH